MTYPQNYPQKINLCRILGQIFLKILKINQDGIIKKRINLDLANPLFSLHSSKEVYIMPARSSTMSTSIRFASSITASRQLLIFHVHASHIRPWFNDPDKMMITLSMHKSKIFS